MLNPQQKVFFGEGSATGNSHAPCPSPAGIVYEGTEESKAVSPSAISPTASQFRGSTKTPKVTHSNPSCKISQASGSHQFRDFLCQKLHHHLRPWWLYKLQEYYPYYQWMLAWAAWWCIHKGYLVKQFWLELDHSLLWCTAWGVPIPTHTYLSNW